MGTKPDGLSPFEKAVIEKMDWYGESLGRIESKLGWLIWLLILLVIFVVMFGIKLRG